MMQTLVGLIRVAALLTLLGVLYSQAAFAQSARKFTNKPITVRLCPGSCRAVNGHGLRPGGSVSVYESRGGWARVSAYLNRAALVPSFGNKITKKPALWVPVASLVTNKPAAKPAAKKAKKAKAVAPKKPKKAAKRVSVIDRVARLRRVPSPVFRPANGNNQPVQTTVAEPVTTTTTEVAVAEPVEKPAPVEKPVVVDTAPVTSVAKGIGSQKALTWEEVQAKIAAQAAGKSAPSAPAAPEKPTEADKAKAVEAAKAKQAEAAAAAAKAAEAEKAKQAEAAATAAKAAEAEKAKQAEAATAAAKAAEAEKAKQAEAAATATKAAEAENAKQVEADKAKVAEAAKDKKAADDKARIAAETKKKLEEQAKAAEAAENAKVAVVLPPKEVEPAVAKAPEPTFKSAKADPIALGARPKKLTKKLLDKRLKKLPGSKSKTPKKVVIALRHYALGLLDSGECKGIERGGASAVPGMLYIACSDDPTYLRQFPLEEETW